MQDRSVEKITILFANPKALFCACMTEPIYCNVEQFANASFQY